MILMCFIKIHKINSSKYACSLDLLAVIFDSWIFITNTKGAQRFYSWKVFICFFKIQKVKSSQYEWSLSLTVESFSQTKKGQKGFTLEWIFMCFIRIHKVKSPKYEWSLDLLTVIFDSWISVTNKKGTKRFYPWKVFICFF